MNSVTIETGETLVATNSVNRAVIRCFDGWRWAIVLRGRYEFILKSARQSPKAFVKIERPLVENEGLGLRHAEINFEKWDREQSTLAEGS